MAKRGTRVLGRGWTRSGTIDAPREERSLTVDEMILRDLKTEPFIAGKTYKILSKRYDVSRSRVQKIKLQNNIS